MAIRQYLPDEQRKFVITTLTEGIPIEDQRGVSHGTKKDFHLAEHIFELLNQDPTLEIRQTIRSMGVTCHSEIKRIEEIIEMMLEHTSTMSRARAQFIVEKESQRMIRMGETQGDWHAIQAGTKNLITTHHLDQQEQEVDRVKDTFVLPIVLAPINEVDGSKHDITEEEKRRLFDKYGASEDDMSRLIREKVALKRQQPQAELEVNSEE